MWKMITPLVLLIVSLVFPFTPRVYAQPSQVGITVFVRDGCRHCKDEEAFLTGLEAKRDDLTVTYYRLENQEQRDIWEEFTTRLGISKVTPITVIGTWYLVGFDNADTTGKEIETLIEDAKSSHTPTDLSKVASDRSSAEHSTCDESGLIPCSDKQHFSLSLPILGTINAQQYPLLFLSALLGFFDGFNPCAMWVLITFLTILIQVGSRRKMLLYAGTFIIAEAVMYTLILTVWYKTWDFIRLDAIVTPVIGLLAIGGGVFFLTEWRKKEIECKVMDFSQRHKTRQTFENLAVEKFTLVTFFAILGIAFSVNVIEFACSIGIPQAFTKVLELNRLPALQNVALLAVYIFFYMVDDFLVFGLALWGADTLHLSTKYGKWSNLIGGLVMLVLGALLIFKPDVLLF